jgi:hypothetical protein
VTPLGNLGRFVAANPGAPPVESEACELCGQPLQGGHRHVLDRVAGTPRCACVACAVLFQTPGGARYQTLGDRVLRDPQLQRAPELFTALQIPVRLAFITCDANLAGCEATYPSVAGPTRAQLPAAACADLAATRLLRALIPGQEALLLYGREPGGPIAGFGVAVDRCYALVGTLRRTWRGFSGGPEAFRAIDAFFADLAQQARSVSEGAAP